MGLHVLVPPPRVGVDPLTHHPQQPRSQPRPHQWPRVPQHRERPSHVQHPPEERVRRHERCFVKDAPADHAEAGERARRERRLEADAPAIAEGLRPCEMKSRRARRARRRLGLSELGEGEHAREARHGEERGLREPCPAGAPVAQLEHLDQPELDPCSGGEPGRVGMGPACKCVRHVHLHDTA